MFNYVSTDAIEYKTVYINNLLYYKNLLYGQIGLSRTMGLALGVRDPVWYHRYIYNNHRKNFYSACSAMYVQMP